MSICARFSTVRIHQNRTYLKPTWTRDSVRSYDTVIQAVDVTYSAREFS